MTTILYITVASPVIPDSWEGSKPEVIVYALSVVLILSLNIHLCFRAYQLKGLTARE